MIEVTKQELIDKYYNEYEKIKDGSVKGFSENVFYTKDGAIICIPGENGYERYPYGDNGFNFWAYSSGYMHANDGLFSPFLRSGEGEDGKVAFFAVAGGKVISLLSVPAFSGQNDAAERFTVFSRDRAMYFTVLPELLFCVCVKVGTGREITFEVHAENRAGRGKCIDLSCFFNPFLRNSIFETSEDRWFRNCRVTDGEEGNLKSFLFAVNEDLSRTESVTNFGVINRSVICDGHSDFIGEKLTTSPKKYKGGNNHNLSNVADTLLRGFEEQSVCAFTENAIAADKVSLRLGMNSSAVLLEQLRISTGNKDPEAYKKLLSFAFTGNRACEKGDAAMLFENGTDESPDAGVMTAFMSCVSKQVEFCSKIKGYVQLSPNSLIGIRDVFQALEGYIYINPEQAKEKMKEAFGFMDPSGRCPRQYGLPGTNGEAPNMDLREFIDQGCWVIDAVTSYLKLTGDLDFLSEECGYYRIVDEAARKVEKSDISDSILEHMIRIMDYLLSKKDEKTGCIRALYGDWNDALDGLGVSPDPNEKFGNGVSVMATLQVVKNINDMICLLGRLNAEPELCKRYEQEKADVTKALFKYAIVENEDGIKRIVHGWGHDRNYFVGSFSDPDKLSRYGLTSNAFWVISGLLREDRTMKATIMEAYRNLDSKYGLKTFEPPFGRDVKGVGRIYKLPEGTAENGASYIHATTFAIMSLFMMGESRKAWEQIRKILPFTHEKVSCSAFVMPNSYGLNEELNIDGESMQDWQTGSSNVLYKVFVRRVFGFDPGYDNLTVCPASYAPYERMQADFICRGKRITVVLEKGGADQPEKTDRRFIVNGEEISGEYDSLMEVKKLVLDYKSLKDRNLITVIG